jgi:hypothetical protein
MIDRSRVFLGIFHILPLLTLMNYLFDVCFWHFLYDREGEKYGDNFDA